MRLQNSYDVMVAGGGPIGLFLAGELRRFGLTVVVIERLAEPSRQIKAGSAGPQTAELFDQRDLLAQFPPPDLSLLARIAPAAGGSTDGGSRGGRTGGNTPSTPTSEAAPTTPAAPRGHFAGLWLLRGAPDIRTLPIFAQQRDIELALARHVTALGVEVQRERELIGLEAGPDGVTATIAPAAEAEEAAGAADTSKTSGTGSTGSTGSTGETSGNGGTVEINAGYVVGCDGGRSIVRKLGGFDFPGTDPTITGRQATVDLESPNPLEKGWHRTARGMIVFGPGPQRVLTVEFDGPPADRDTPVDRDEMQASLRRVSGTEVTVTALHTGTRWTDNTRQATEYRRGRILLAGDSAHIHPPFGGQGLNLGFQDAANLGWKLAATIAGWAPPGLLDSYTTERHPAGAAALANTRAQIALMRPDPQTSALRELFTDLLAYDEPNQHVSRLMTGVDRPYDVDGDHPEAGRMVADRPVGDQRLYELLRTPGGLLLDGSADQRWSRLVAAGWADRVGTATGTAGPESLLIRPDGIVAWGVEKDDPTDQNDENGENGENGEDALVAALTRWFGAPTPGR